MHGTTLRDRARRVRRYVTSDVWLERAETGPPARRGLIWLLRRAFLAALGFVDDQCLLRASALTMTFVLSMVPFLAVVFSITKGLGVHNAEVTQMLLLRLAAGNPDTVARILEYVERTSAGRMGAVSAAFLLVTAGMLMANIERSFNAIWKVRQGRSPWRKFTDFFSVMLVCPLLMGTAVTLGASLRSGRVLGRLLEVAPVGAAYLLLLKLVPLFMVFVVLLFLYSYIPNTRVRPRAAMAGALLAAMAWQGAEYAYMAWQARFASYGLIYGSFAQVPLFLMWLYVSWAVVLFGVEVCHAVQNAPTFEKHLRAGRVSRLERDRLAVLAMLLLTRAFVRGTGAVPGHRMAALLDAPDHVLDDVLDRLAREGMVVRVCDDAPAWVLGMPPDELRIADVLLALAGRTRGEGEERVATAFEFINDTLARLAGDMAASPANTTLRAYHDTTLPDWFDAAPPGAPETPENAPAAAWGGAGNGADEDAAADETHGPTLPELLHAAVDGGTSAADDVSEANGTNGANGADGGGTGGTGNARKGDPPGSGRV
ncbi:YhjD/YihY/BrkB family envelope integrity protein [Nitratidesulfovibrio sp.]|uniref:YhjD/YihY/BrkB family envelope integrity protein n=1 Tax=Nitratidesulfovibrio sp. TaxID=2802297 RepID=UPI00333F85EA